MVVGVVEEQWIGHFFNGRLATRTGIAAPAGEFEFAGAAHDLMLLLGSHHPATAAAADESREGEFVM
jgi:hypothetical protein